MQGSMQPSQPVLNPMTETDSRLLVIYDRVPQESTQNLGTISSLEVQGTGGNRERVEAFHWILNHLPSKFSSASMVCRYLSLNWTV